MVMLLPLLLSASLAANDAPTDLVEVPTTTEELRVGQSGPTKAAAWAMGGLIGVGAVTLSGSAIFAWKYERSDLAIWSAVSGATLLGSGVIWFLLQKDEPSIETHLVPVILEKGVGIAWSGFWF